MSILQLKLLISNPPLEASKVARSQRYLYFLHPAAPAFVLWEIGVGLTKVRWAVQAVYQYGFVLEFETEEDWKYYVHEDPAHIEFKKGMKGLVEKVGCFDYQPGVF